MKSYKCPQVKAYGTSVTSRRYGANPMMAAMMARMMVAMMMARMMARRGF